MASPKQVALFERLTTDRDFSGKDTSALKMQFGTLTDKNASEWIERALDLPKKPDDPEAAAREAASRVAPPF